MPDPAPSSVNLASTGTTLLGPDDPPPFEILHPAGRAPLLIICDHASRAMPRALGRLGLDETLLMRHIGWDIGAAEVTRRLAALLDAPAVLCGYSRLVIDCNRGLGDPTSIPEESDGVAVPGNTGLTPAARVARVDGIFRPYHAAIEAQPYSAREPSGYSIRTHAEPAGLPHAAVEIRQDLIDTPSGAAQWADILAAALAPILARPDLNRVERF